MKILEIINAPWMLTREKLSQIAAIYATHLQGDKIDFKAFQFDKPDPNARRFEVVEGNALIDVQGPLTPGASFFSFYFGGTSLKDVQKNIQAALDADDVERIILRIDSPGGSVQGTFELAEFIERATDEKPIITFSDGTVASAAYMLAAATNGIYITGKTNQIGSIGVIARRYDDSKWNEDKGLLVEEFVSGRYKNIASPDKPIDDFDREAIQDQVDYLFSIFANEVSRLRDIEVKTIQKWEARVFIGEQALAAGLVDGVSTLDQIIGAPSGMGAEAFNSIKKVKMTEQKLTLESLQTDHPEVYEEVKKASFLKGHEAGMKDGKEIGAKDERLRIQGIQKVFFKGHEELLESMISDGAVTVGEAAIRFNEAERTVREKAGADEANAMPKPIETDEPGEPKPKPTEETDPKAVWDGNAELRAEFGDVYERYEAFLKADKKGLVKILSRTDA